MSELRRKSRSLSRAKVSPRRSPKNQPRLEELETRTLLSTTLLGSAAGTNYVPADVLEPPVTPGVAPLTPAEMRAAYGINLVQFSSGGTMVPGNGAGQTIAIVDALNDPDIVADLKTFDATFGLPDPPSFTVLNQNGAAIPNQTGSPTSPRNSGTSSWALEESLDVEWAHVIAPAANIVLFEANSSSNANLQTAVTTAAKASVYAGLGIPTASVISNSYGGSERSAETTTDTTVYKPISDANQISLVFSSGDNGLQEYPSTSPYVLGVGGTEVSLKVSPFGVSYSSETTYNDTQTVTSSGVKNFGSSGGGTSAFETEPSYQLDYGITNSAHHREAPDVSMSGGLESGVYISDTFDAPGTSAVGTVFGTSLAAPMWGGLIAVVNQGRSLAGTGPIGNVQEAVYSLPTSDFHDITTGTNGLTGANLRSAGPGYDEVTGIGSPIGNKLIPALVAFTGTGPVGTFVPPAADSSGDSTPADDGDDTSSPISEHTHLTEAQAAAPVLNNVQTVSVETAATPMTEAVRDLTAGSVTVVAPSSGQAQRGDTTSATQLTALPVAATASLAGFHGDSTVVVAGTASDAAPVDGVLPTEIAPQGDFAPVATTTDVVVKAAPATPAADGVAAPVTPVTASDAVFADLGATQQLAEAPAAVIAAEETHSADLAVFAGLALALGGLPGAFVRQEETRKIPALRGK
jgi:subtilase family serine protease